LSSISIKLFMPVVTKGSFCMVGISNKPYLNSFRKAGCC